MIVSLSINATWPKAVKTGDLNHTHKPQISDLGAYSVETRNLGLTIEGCSHNNTINAVALKRRLQPSQNESFAVVMEFRLCAQVTSYAKIAT